ncbi:TolC family protein [Litoribacter populi]|uniref:TolC family protein n=1 Tax=Litoribacter populi TaxID=2598460 RepID=UPI00117BF134|nr:TolC family protein [Litoribacter populi]
MRRLIGITGLLVFLLSNVSAQDTLSYNQFIKWVSFYHPVVNQAVITTEMGRQELRMARGGFDPFLFGNLDEKEYNNVGYYHKREAGVVVPTMGGVQLKGLVEQNTGQYLNPERRVPTEGLMTVGASVNLGQGLMIDSRRRALRQAEIYRDATLSEQQLMLNRLYLDANQVYWRWAAAYQDVTVMREAVELAKVRFRGIRDSFIYGDLPAIDTLEAHTQVLNREYRLQAKEMEYFEAQQMLEIYLWDEYNEPMNLGEQVIPQDLSKGIDMSYSLELLRANLTRHPELQLLDFDLASLEVERRWRADQLKPVAQLHYNILTNTTNGFENGGHVFFENNYKWGATVRMPLFLRRERGALGIVKSQINFTTQDRDMKFVRLKATLESELNNMETLQGQFRTFSENLFGLERLLEGEQTRFEMGESSLFLINAREVSVIEGQLILNDVIARKNIAYAKLLFAAGLGFEQDVED